MKVPEEAVPPHPTLSAYYDNAAARSPFVRDLFDRSAADYDSINKLFSLGTGSWFRRRSLLRAGLRPGMRIADIAIGTGLVAREAAALLGQADNVVGLDLSAAMLQEARKKLGVRLVRCRAEALCLADESVDFLTMGYALRHVPDLRQAFAEFHRVLRPGGCMLILEIGRPIRRSARLMARLYFDGFVPAVARLYTRNRDASRLMHYYWDTIDHCVPSSTILDAMTGVGFEAAKCESIFDLFRNYLGHKPV